MPFPSPRVIIVGGGLAGMACAVALESAGLFVTLIESRKSLGGRAGSFDDPQTGEQLDNCQHVLLGCCTNLIDFYRRIGSIGQIQFHRAIHFRDPRGRRHDLYGTPRLPAPLHLARSLAGFSILTPAERLKLVEAMLRMADTNMADLLDVPFGEWLDANGQPESLVKKLYDAVVISGLNEETRAASAAYAIQIFQKSLLANAAGYVVGMPSGTLGDLYATVPCRNIQLGTRAREIAFQQDRVTALLLQDDTALTADAYVLATNHHAAQKWLPSPLAAGDARFAGLHRFESVPILGAHLWFDRPVLKESHAAFISGPLQWIFRKDSSGASLHGVISAARAWVDVPKETMLAMFERQVRETFQEARQAKLLRGVIVIEKRATFSPTPGIDRIRPAQGPPRGGISNLYLAGDYTQTGWPATMEGAVRSGYLAADAVVRQLLPGQHHATFLVPDLEPQWPARLLGLSG